MILFKYVLSLKLINKIINMIKPYFLNATAF